MTVADLHRRACEVFGQYVHEVKPDQWDAPTPCTEWDVRALVNHLVYEDRWTVPLVAGGTVAEVGDQFEGDLLGDDPVAAYDDAMRGSTAAFAEPGALERTVHLSFGDFPGEEYAWQLFSDHLIHAWDLAHAIGSDERLDPELVEACAGWYAGQEALYRSSGAVGPRPDIPPDADPQTVLLAAFGRRVVG